MYDVFERWANCDSGLRFEGYEMRRICMFLFLVVQVASCDRQPSRQASGSSVLSFRDSVGQITVSYESTLTSYLIALEVDNNGVRSRRTLDDKTVPTHLRLIAHNNWVLVANGKYVLGGVNRATSGILGEGDWSELPFTIWQGQGKVVAERKYSSAEAEPPRGLPEIYESATGTGEGR